MRTAFHLTVGLSITMLVTVGSAAEEARFIAIREDGSVLTTNRLDGILVWSGRGPGPSNPLRYLRDLQSKVVRQGPYVQFANGDILPGTPLRVVPAGRGDRSKGQLVVKVTPPLFTDREVRPITVRHDRGGYLQSCASAEVAVRLDRVARIVSGAPSQLATVPGTLGLSNGRLVRFKAVKWDEDGFTALTDNDLIRAGYPELQEYHAKTVDRWNAIVDDAAVPCPDPDSPLVCIQMRNGAVLTARGIMDVSATANIRGRENWIAVTPSWALGSLSFDARDIASRSYRSTSEVPLSLLDATTLAQRSFTGYVWPWQRNRNVRLGELRSGAMRSGEGFGMHSYTALAIDLPPGAEQFSSWVGLDNEVGKGGCVQCRVIGDRLDAEPLWQSGYLRGSAAPVRVGPIDIAGLKRLILVADFGHDGRPKGADPMDILDEVDWLTPMLKLDTPIPPRREDVSDVLPQIARWSVPTNTFNDMSVVLALEMGKGLADAVFIEAPCEIRMKQVLTVSDATAMLRIAAARGEKGAGGHRISLFADGKRVNTLHGNEESLYTGASGVPFRHARKDWDLRDYLGKDVLLELVVAPVKQEENPLPGLVLGYVELLSHEEFIAERKKTLDHTDDRIVSWQMSGPYPGEPKTVFDTVFPPEQPGNDNVEWRPAPVLSSGIVHFGSIFGGDNRAAYLKCVVESPEKRDVYVELGTDDGVKVWLNGERVYANSAGGGIRHRLERCEATLQKGDNHLLMKVVNYAGDWAGWAKMIDRDGTSLYGKINCRAE